MMICFHLLPLQVSQWLCMLHGLRREAWCTHASPGPARSKVLGRPLCCAKLSLCCSYPRYRQSAWRVRHWNTDRTCPSKEKQPSGSGIPVSNNLQTHLSIHEPPEKEKIPKMSNAPSNHKLSWLTRTEKNKHFHWVKAKGPCNVILICWYSWFLFGKAKRCEPDQSYFQDI